MESLEIERAWRRVAFDGVLCRWRPAGGEKSHGPDSGEGGVGE